MMVERTHIVLQRERAKMLVATQLAEAEGLMSRDLPTVADLKDAEDQKSVWLAVTEETLRQIASDDSLAEDFRNSLYGYVGSYMKQSHETEVDDFRKILGRSVVKLRGINKRLDLIPEKSEVGNTAETLTGGRVVSERGTGDFEWDVFISHASEDKDKFVRELAEKLEKRGLRVWYDESTMTVGDSLRGSIDKGLAKSRYGVVVLSHDFFAKAWPLKELDGLDAREPSGTKVILPVWLDVDRADVAKYSPLLANRLAAEARNGIDHVVDQLVQAMQPEPAAAVAQVDAPSNEMELRIAVLDQIAEGRELLESCARSHPDDLDENYANWTSSTNQILEILRPDLAKRFEVAPVSEPSTSDYKRSGVTFGGSSLWPEIWKKLRTLGEIEKELT